MKKALIYISITAVIAGAFAACSAGGANEASTTAVTDAQGETHYYEIVSDESTTALAEIETNGSGKAVTDKNGAYVTSKNTTSLSAAENKTTAAKGKSESSAALNSDDNVVEFDTTAEESSATVAETTEPQTDTQTDPDTADSKIGTDSDGWVNKWY